MRKKVKTGVCKAAQLRDGSRHPFGMLGGVTALGGGELEVYPEAARGYYSQNAGQRGGRYDGKLPAANGGCGHCVGSVAAVDAGDFAFF